MERALVTGITGFVGSHLAEYLLENGFEVYGTVRWRSNTENIDHIKDKIKLIESDIRDSHSVNEAIKEAPFERSSLILLSHFVQSRFPSFAVCRERGKVAWTENRQEMAQRNRRHRLGGFQVRKQTERGVSNGNGRFMPWTQVQELGVYAPILLKGLEVQVG